MKNDTNALRSDCRDCVLIPEVRKLKKELITTKKELAVYKTGVEKLINMIDKLNREDSPCDYCPIATECESEKLSCIDVLKKHFLKGE